MAKRREKVTAKDQKEAMTKICKEDLIKKGKAYYHNLNDPPQNPAPSNSAPSSSASTSSRIEKSYSSAQPTSSRAATAKNSRYITFKISVNL